MTTKATIKIGRCDICGGEAVIVTVDPGTGLRAGRCCEQSLDDAHRLVNLTMANIAKHGLRHPHPGEFATGDNH